MSWRFHSEEGINTVKRVLCEASFTALSYTMKSLVVILGLLVAAVQVYNFKIQLFMAVIFEFRIELWTYVFLNMQNSEQKWLSIYR